MGIVYNFHMSHLHDTEHNIASAISEVGDSFSGLGRLCHSCF